LPIACFLIIGTAACDKSVPPPASFVGGQACAGCHQAETALWQGSHHDQAMQVASDQTVLGDFDDATLTHFGVTTTFSRKDGRFLVRTDGPDGSLQDYEVAYTFGTQPLQQYLIAFPGGRYQALGIAWDSRPASAGGQRWFHLYPDEAVPAGDPLHWTGLNQNWNNQCADCHSTNLRRNFDPATQSYDTTWSDVDVACEACHGPGSGHVAWAKQPGTGSDEGRKGLVTRVVDGGGGHWVRDPGSDTAARTRPLSSREEIETCGLCHARRQIIGEGFAYGQPLLDTAVPALLEAGTYHPDGQLLAEDYEYGSFLQSRMYEQGVTCSDCHEPHSLQLRAPGNAVCAQCHSPDKFDTVDHSHHPPGSAGATCTGCHMPTRTFMGIDARHDHAIRVPRPDLSTSLDTPNACTNCHGDRPASWAAEQVAQWYGPERRAEPHYGSILAAGREGEPGAGAALAGLATDHAQSGIVRASALAQLADRWPESLPAHRSGLQDGDALVRLAAVGALAPYTSDQAVVDELASLLDDTMKAVRIATARTLAAVPPDDLSPDQQAAQERASDELRFALAATDDRPESLVSLGAFEAERGRHAEAESAYRQALRLDPGFVPALVNLADLFRALTRDEEAEPLLRQAIAAAPNQAAAHHALGLLLVRRHELPAALLSLQQAVNLAPENAHYSYVHALALNSAGRPQDALATLRQAHERHPADREVLMALATISRDTADLAAATSYAERLARLAPSDPQVQALLDSLTGR
jgi:predicted CXXCH cytochrome family protein